MRFSSAHVAPPASQPGQLLGFNHAHYVDNFTLIVLTPLIELELFHNYASVTERGTWPQVLYVFFICTLCA